MEIGNFGFGDSGGGGGGGTIGGGGTLNYIAKFTPDGSTINNSLLFDNGTSVGLGTNTPDASAILELSSTTQGFAAPRMTTLQRDAIVAPIVSLLIFNTSSGFYNYWDGVAWIQMDTSTGGDVSGSGTTNYAVKWTDGANSVIGDGTWAFSGNDYYPVTTGSNIGDATHRIGTIFMASVFDYANNLTFFNGTSTTMTLTTGGQVGIGITPTIADSKLEVKVATNQRFNFRNVSVPTLGDTLILQNINDLGNDVTNVVTLGLDWYHASRNNLFSNIANIIVPTAKVHIIGNNTFADLFALKVDNLGLSPLLYVRNDAKVSIGKATTLTTLDILGDTTNTLFKLNNANFAFADKLRIDNNGSFYSGSINAFGGFGTGTYTTDHLDYTLNTAFSTYLAFTNAGGVGNKTSYGIIGGAIGSSDSDYRLVILNSDTSTISGSGLKVLSTGGSGANDGFDYYNYGVNINSSGVVTNSGSGTFYKVGLNVNVSNGEVNYAALFNGGNSGFGLSTPTATIHAKGIDATSANYSLRVENSAGVNLLSIANDNLTTVGAVGGNARVRVNLGNSQTFNIDANDYATFTMSDGGSNWFTIAPTAFNEATLSSTGILDIYGGGLKTVYARFSESAGGIGISIQNPTARLHVQGRGSTSATSALKVENSLGRNLLSLGDGINSSIGDFNYTSFFQVRGVGGDVNIQSDTNLLFFEIRPAAVNSLMSFSKGSSGTDVFATVDSSRGNWVFSNLSTSFNIQDTTTKVKIIGIDATSSNYALKVDNSASSPLLYVRNDGNTNINGRVGIGAVSTDEALFITNTNGDNARITLYNQLAGGAFSQYYNLNNGVGNGMFVGVSGTGYGILGTNGAFDLRIRTNSVEHSIIKSNGNWGIGTLTPLTSALLDLTSTTGALLVPRMTTTEKNALTAVNGMILYDSTLNKFQGYEAGAWVNLV
jgi:hypothetical protein